MDQQARTPYYIAQQLVNIPDGEVEQAVSLTRELYDLSGPDDALEMLRQAREEKQNTVN